MPRVREASRRAADFIELATEAASFQQLSDFLNNFSRRVARTLSAKWCGVVVFSGGSSKLHSAMPADAVDLNEAVLLTRANAAALHSNQKSAFQPFSVRISDGNSPELFLIPVRASNGEALGAICVYGAAPAVFKHETKLLRALANHAALSLEASLRFSQLERSKRQWVQDIDAISDYIVVHDRHWKIVRTNRSLADYLGRSPVELVGEPVSSLRRLALGDAELPCPFCLNAGLNKEEHTVSSAE